MFLQTNRLTLRDFTLNDLDDLADLLANEEVMRFSVGGPLSCSQVKDYLENRIMGHYPQHGFGLYAVVPAKDNRVIGYAGFMLQSIDGEDFVELGYRLHPSFWGKGLASEAAQALIEYGFNNLHFDRIISIIDPRNSRSLKVAARAGMHYWKDAAFHGISVQIYMIRKVVVSQYNLEWDTVFEEIKEQLKKVFLGIKIEFSHIGSTSIPGCSAKPIVDILGTTPDVLEIDAFNQAMSSIGFKAFGEYGMKQRRFFQKREGFPVNLHIFEETDPEVKRHLRFCDYLKSHPEKIEEYSLLKQRLAKQFPHDIQQYILGKEKFIKGIDISAAWHFPTEKQKKEDLKRSEWSLEQILQAMRTNMHLQMTYFAKYIPSTELVFEPDVTVVRSQIQDDTFNYVLSARFSESNVRDRISHVASLFKKFHLPFSWWVGESDLPASLENELKKQGFVFKEKNIGMYAKINDLSLESINSSLEFKRVENISRLQDFSNIITEIGGNPEAFDLIYSKIPPAIYSGPVPLEIYVAYIGNEPVTSGILVSHANVVGIYYVATIPQQRKQGFGGSMMIHLLRRAKEKGYSIAVLQASGQGKAIYEKLGFKACCSFSEYAPMK